MTALENVALPLGCSTTPTPWRVPARGWPRSALPPGWHTIRPSSPAGSSSGWRLPGAFAGEPSLLLADEPTGNLDGATGGAVVRLLYRRNATLLLITHDPAVAQACDRIVEIRDGRIAATAAPPRRRFGVGR